MIVGSPDGPHPELRREPNWWAYRGCTTLEPGGLA